MQIFIQWLDATRLEESYTNQRKKFIFKLQSFISYTQNFAKCQIEYFQNGRYIHEPEDK